MSRHKKKCKKRRGDDISGDVRLGAERDAPRTPAETNGHQSTLTSHCATSYEDWMIECSFLLRKKSFTRAEFVKQMEPFVGGENFLHPASVEREILALFESGRNNTTHLFFTTLLTRCLRELKNQLLHFVDVIPLLRDLHHCARDLSVGMKVSPAQLVDLSVPIEMVCYAHQHPELEAQILFLQATFSVLRVLLNASEETKPMNVHMAFRMGLVQPVADLLNACGEDARTVAWTLLATPGSLDSQPSELWDALDNLVVQLFREIALTEYAGEVAMETARLQLFFNFFKHRGWRAATIAQLGYFGQVIRASQHCVDDQEPHVVRFAFCGLNIIALFLKTAEELGPSVANLPGNDRPALEHLLGTLYQSETSLEFAYLVDQVAATINFHFEANETRLSTFPPEIIADFLTFESPFMVGGLQLRAQWLLDRAVRATANSGRNLPMLFNVLIATVEYAPSYQELWDSESIWTSLEARYRGRKDSPYFDDIYERSLPVLKFLGFVAQFEQGCELIARGAILGIIAMTLRAMQGRTEYPMLELDRDYVYALIAQICTSLAFFTPNTSKGNFRQDGFQPLRQLIFSGEHKYSQPQGLFAANLFASPLALPDITTQGELIVMRVAFIVLDRGMTTCFRENDLVDRDNIILATWHLFQRQLEEEQAFSEFEPLPKIEALLIEASQTEPDETSPHAALIRETALDALEMLAEINRLPVPQWPDCYLEAIEENKRNPPPPGQILFSGDV